MHGAFCGATPRAFVLLAVGVTEEGLGSRINEQKGGSRREGAHIYAGTAASDQSFRNKLEVGCWPCAIIVSVCFVACIGGHSQLQPSIVWGRAAELSTKLNKTKLQLRTTLKRERREHNQERRKSSTINNIDIDNT